MARSRTRKRTPEEKKKRQEERRAKRTGVGNNEVGEKVSEIEKETSSISNPTKKENKKPKTTTVKLVYNEKTKKCTIFDENGQIIGEEYAEKLAINFASKRASFTTNRADLETYDIGTGKKVLSAFYSGNEIIEKI